MDILWTSYLQRPDKVFTSYGLPVDILWTSYGHPTYSDQKRSSHPMDILWWTSYGHPMDILPTATRKGLHILWTSFGLGVVAASNDESNNVMCCFGSS